MTSSKKKPLAYLFTDFHAHLFKDFSHPDAKYHTDRFKAQLDTLETILCQAREDDLPVIFGGDLFHKRIYVDSRVFNPVFEMFEAYSDVTVYMVRGNHDSVTNSLRTVSSLDTFSSLPNVTVISTPQIIVHPTFMLFGLPYGEETEEMKEWLTKTADTHKDNKLPKVLVAHVGVEGATTGKYSHTLEGAFRASDLLPEAFDYIYLGHYHKRQELLPNMIYGGNTIQTSFSDEGQTKGYHLLYQDGDKVQTEYIEIPNKMFITITGDEIPSDDILRNNYIRFTGNEEQAKIVQTIRDEENLTNMRITVQKEYNDGSRLGITAETSEEEIVSAYVESKELGDAVEQKALACLREAKALS